LYHFSGDLRRNTRKELNKAVEDFAAEIKALAERLKSKHLKERILLRNLKLAAQKEEVE